MNCNMKDIISESFKQYAGAVLQSRALVDVRDCLKPSARQIFYCLNTDKFTASKPFKKTLKCIGSAMRLYIHGDASCEGVIMRAGQPFAMRYPLVEVEGSYGNLIESGNWAASRYTSSRLSKISDCLFLDMGKNTISEWRDNYDDTEKYPAVLPSKGFYNIVNGTVGIGVGAASSIPAFNLTEVNNALIKLLQNPDVDFDEIYCAPDFATGAILLNEGEVKESLKNGVGKSCKLRSVIEYDSDENCLVVKEIPYGVYTNTICGELEAIINSGEPTGIERFNDLTGEYPNIKIYLTKRANPSQVLRYLYKNTSLQSHFGINMTMLEDGRFPKVFGWKEALSAHIEHEKIVYRKGFLYDLNKMEDRIHILDGMLIALASIDEVVDTIKKAKTTFEASENLQKNFLLDEVQAKAVLEIKLSRLARLEVEKIEDEKCKLSIEVDRIKEILNNETLFNNEIINGWKEVSSKYGDARRTQIMDIESEDDDEPIETKNFVICVTNHNNLYAYEESSLITQKRGGKGNKVKLEKTEFIKQTFTETNSNNVLVFSDCGKVYNLPLKDIEPNTKINISSLIKIDSNENVTKIVSIQNEQELVFVTENGQVKRTKISEYNFKRTDGVMALKLKDSSDKLVQVFPCNQNDEIGIGTKNGYFCRFFISEIPCTGRVTSGVKGIKLKKEDSVIDAIRLDKNITEIATITKMGYIKRTFLDEFSLGSRGNVGTICHKLEDDNLVKIAGVTKESKEFIVSNDTNFIKININEISTNSKNTIGKKSIDLKENQQIKDLVVM